VDGVVILDTFLRQLQASSLAPQLVLRGSQLTARWVPGRIAQDLDFVIEGEWTVATLTAAASSVAPSLTERLETIWAETEWPGLRLHLVDGAEKLQVDISFNEPIGIPPQPTGLRGHMFRAVGPEMMLGWKIHSLVERGPRGRWHAKTLADLVLIDRHTTTDPSRVKACVETAFAIRRMTLRELDGMLNDETWGLSRGSRNKWKSYSKKAPWVDFPLAEAISQCRAIVRKVLSA